MSIKVSQLLEAIEKRGVLVYGRMNPPTMGHAKLIDTALAEPGNKRIYVSHIQDNKKNPLSADEKLEILHKMYPNHKHFFRKASKEEPTIFHAAAKMHKEGIKHLTVIAGEDRVKEFQDKLNAYNGKFDKDGNGYHFKSITVKSAGTRDPDAEGMTGISATKMRQAALKGDKKTFRAGLHHNITDKESDNLMTKIKERMGIVSEDDELRNDYILGDTFKIGEFVTNQIHSGEIIFRGANYVTIVSEGKDHKLWIDEIQYVDGESKRNQIYKESFIFKGYKSKNLTRELAEQFRNISKSTDDQYALLSCLKACDYILGVNEQIVINNFRLVKIQLERAKRYANKFSINISEQLQLVEENCLKLAILEDYKFSTTDKMMIARVIASVSDVTPSGNDPSAIINKAIVNLRNSQLTPQGWELIGRMLRVATDAGIKWNKDNFALSIQKQMGL
jgi:hypothetical protein